MHEKAQQVFYILSGFLLMTAFFVMQPSSLPEVTALQGQIKQEISVAWQQTMGDQPYFTDVADVYDGINAFYDQSSGSMVGLLTQPETDEDLIYVFRTTFNIFAQVLEHNQPRVAGVQTENLILPPLDKFMSEPAINNIVPLEKNQTQVSGAVFQAWNNIQDATTGQVYCLAIYYGEVNKYLGPCKYDYH